MADSIIFFQGFFSWTNNDAEVADMLNECPPEECFLRTTVCSLFWSLSEAPEASPGLASRASGKPRLLPSLRTPALRSFTFLGSPCPFVQSCFNFCWDGWPSATQVLSSTAVFSKSIYWGKSHPARSSLSLLKGLHREEHPWDFSLFSHPQILLAPDLQDCFFPACSPIVIVVSP